MHPHIPRGAALLHDPSLNKGTAFTEAERDAWACAACCRRTSDAGRAGRARARELPPQADDALEKYIYLTALHDRNEALFFRVVDREPRRDDADHLHADGGAGVPEVRRTSSSARAASSSPPTTAATMPKRCCATGPTATSR